MMRSDRPSFGVLLLALLCAFSFGAIVRVATAGTSYHQTCVWHGFLDGASPSDGSWFARVEGGCNPGTRDCAIYSYGVWRGSSTAWSGSLCNAWSRSFGDYTECAGSARLSADGVFSTHYHYPEPENRC